MIIRLLDINEIEKLYPLADKFFQSSELLKDFDRNHFKKQWTMFIGNGCGIVFVAEKDNKIIGALGALKFNDPNNGYLIASELFWFVDPKYRGCGISLLRSFEIWAKRQGCKQVIMVYLMDSMPDIVKKIYEKRNYMALEVHYVKEI